MNKGNDRITQCDSVYRVRHPRGSFIVPGMSIAVCGSGHTRKQQSINSTLSSLCKKSRPQKRFLVGCGSPFTRLAQHLTVHSASRLVQARSSWSVKTGCAPSKHYRDAGVYGYTTTAMHALSTPPRWRHAGGSLSK